MARIKQNFDLFEGEDKQVNFTILDEAGAPVVLTDLDAVWVMARIQDTDNILITKTTGGGDITVGGDNSNIYQVALDENDTDQLHGKYRHELRVTTLGSESVLAIGQVQIYHSLTNNI